MNEASVYDVAVVGLGPAGAFASALLGQAGLKVYACDKLEGVYGIPRAIALDHEIMRVFQQLGMLDAVAPHCEPFTPSEYFGVDGKLIRRMTMVAPPYPQGHTPSIVFSQPPVERALRARIAEMPNVDVALGAEVLAVEQDAHAASLRVRTSDGGTQVIKAKFVIACDGGSSRVRSLLDMPLDDLGFDEPWLVVDVLLNDAGLAKLPKVSMQYCEPQRPCTLVIGPKNHRRWEISLKPGEDAAQAATPEGTWRLLSRWITPEDGQLWRQASYRFHALVASRWREGRVFLAGDAAHMQPPFLGQGMCQGVRDVANLSWKLASVLDGSVKGAAAQDLLDSYGIERKAHVRELTSRIKAIGAVICERDSAKARERDAQMLADCGGVVKDTPRQDILPKLEAGFMSSHAHAARGSLFPQPRLMDTAGRPQLMDEKFGHGWRLVTCANAEAGKRLPPAITLVDLAQTPEADGVVAQWMAKFECEAALVRPDNYVFGAASGAGEISALLDEWQQRMAPAAQLEETN
ncbi:MAG: bifunctional 3-(3-hydroxy-phenyl)propionate/3-hydroxycinnamic acid hydroxylase [Pseudomonadota bacterium]